MKDSNYTKSIIVNSFKELMQKKSFDKISINDITSNCYLNRQTFYYHFQDKYELMNYIYYHEIFLPLVDGLNENNYLERFEQMFAKMKKEETLYFNAITMSGDYGFKEYIQTILKELITELCPNEKSINIDFYTYGLSGVIINWIHCGMKTNPQELSNLLIEIIQKKSWKTISLFLQHFQFVKESLNFYEVTLFEELDFL